MKSISTGRFPYRQRLILSAKLHLIDGIIGEIYFIKNNFKFDKMKGTKKNFGRYPSSKNFHTNANDYDEHTNTNIK